MQARLYYGLILAVILLSGCATYKVADKKAAAYLEGISSSTASSTVQAKTKDVRCPPLTRAHSCNEDSLKRLKDEHGLDAFPLTVRGKGYSREKVELLYSLAIGRLNCCCSTSMNWEKSWNECSVEDQE